MLVQGTPHLVQQLQRLRNGARLRQLHQLRERAQVQLLVAQRYEPDLAHVRLNTVCTRRDGRNAHQSEALYRVLSQLMKINGRPAL